MGPEAWGSVPGSEASSGHLGTTGDCLWWAKLDELKGSWLNLADGCKLLVIFEMTMIHQTTPNL